MKKKDLERYRRVLLEELAATQKDEAILEREGRGLGSRDSVDSVQNYPHHLADAATDTQEREMSFALAESKGEIVYEIEQALRRISEGVFGICQACGKTIAAGRLRVLPYARLCVPCQEEDEREAGRT